MLEVTQLSMILPQLRKPCIHYIIPVCNVLCTSAYILIGEEDDTAFAVAGTINTSMDPILSLTPSSGND